jgi:hypothetical protein
MTDRDNEFDQLTRKLSTTTSRRHALKIFGLATVGGVTSLVGAGSARAAPGRCFNGGHGCRQNEECCSKFCDPTTATCACAPGTYMCPDTGICVSCPSGYVFNATTCECECPAGTIPVNGTCCANPLQCSVSSDCCPGFRCDPKTGRCMPCTNPPACKSSAECCSGYVCADNPATTSGPGICVPASTVP